MKKLVAAAVAIAVLPALPTLAADPVVFVPPMVTPVYVPPPPAPPDWAGPYIGLHIGYGFGRETDNQSEQFLLTEVGATADSFELRGLIAGIHAGYNFQSGNLVFGIEGDLDWARLRGSADYQYGPYIGTLSFLSDLQASIRGRAGFLVGPDTLVYATAGIAFARGTLTDTYDEMGPVTLSDTQWHRGLTFGGGVEHRFTEQLAGRLEIRHTRFGTEEYDLGYPGGPVDVNFNQTTITAGITFQF